MATYYFNQSKTREVQAAIINAPPGSEVWFQPTHHGGCVQVCRITDRERCKDDYCVNVFRSRSANTAGFRMMLPALQNDCLQLGDDWCEQILRCKRMRFTANVKKGVVVICLITTHNGEPKNESQS